MRTRLLLSLVVGTIIGGLVVAQYPVGYNPLDGVTSGGVDSIRLTDPVTGAGLFTTNTDPTVTGVDPLTEADSPEGTDVGFGRPLRAFISSGMYNGDFRARPADPTAPIVGTPELADYNPLPYWRVVQDPVGRASVTWQDDTTGGSLLFAVATGEDRTDADRGTYAEQLVPVVPLVGNRLVLVVSVVLGTTFSTTAHGARLSLEARYLDGALGTLGSEEVMEVFGDDLTPAGYVLSVVPNRGTGAPSDAMYLRVRIRFRNDNNSTAAQSVAVDQVYIRGMATSTVAYLGLGSGATYHDLSLSDGGYADIFAAADTWSVSADNSTITGIDAAEGFVGRDLWLHNDASLAGGGNLILQHDAGGGSGSSANNRFYCPNSANLTVRPYGTVHLRYLADVNGGHLRWRVMSQV